MKSKKILFFHHNLETGGVERQLYYLVNGIAKYHDVCLLLCEKRGEFLQFVDSDVSIKTLDAPCKHRLQLKLVVGLINNIKRDQPDVLISFHGKLHWISILAAKLLGIKVVCVFPGYMSKGLLWPVHSLIFSMSDGLVAVSNSVKTSLIKNFHIRTNKIKVIENTIDSSRIWKMAEEALTFQEKQYFDGGSAIISIGRLEKGKGFDVILDALSNIKKDYSFMIIGDGPERQNLEEKIHSLGLSNHVLLLGMQQNPYKFLKRASFFVLASESEGLPTVILEAMSLNIPCICSKYRGGTEGVICHKQNGYLFNANDPKDLEKAIEIFLSPDSIKMLNSFSNAGKVLISKKFNIDQYINKYLAYLQGIQ